MKFKMFAENLRNGGKLTRQEAYALMNNIGEGKFNEIQKAALIAFLSNRDTSLDEMTGFREALLDLSIPTTIASCDAIDLCGTGGDEKNTFNISTLASFVVAATGYKVAKHGNYGVSSVCGSSNILEKLGYRFSNDSSKLEKELNELNLCFLHAPLFHPALKNVAAVRKQMGIKTIFNKLGPLVNPAKTKKQLVGVYHLKLARLYHYLLQQEQKEYAVVHSLDGYDEISLTAGTQYLSSDGECVLEPNDFGMQTLAREDLFGGKNPKEVFDIFLKITQNKGTEAQTNVVIANAAAGIKCFEKEKSLQDCAAMARETIESGKAYRLLKNLIEIQ